MPTFTAFPDVTLPAPSPFTAGAIAVPTPTPQIIIVERIVTPPPSYIPSASGAQVPTAVPIAGKTISPEDLAALESLETLEREVALARIAKQAKCVSLDKKLIDVTNRMTEANLGAEQRLRSQLAQSGALGQVSGNAALVKQARAAAHDLNEARNAVYAEMFANGCESRTPDPLPSIDSPPETPTPPTPVPTAVNSPSPTPASLQTATPILP